uniref:Uncharacterized protein n=1 Tax=Arundo donax TaxID=35708 RepID=A0A0A9C932_ARUDO
MQLYNSKLQYCAFLSFLCYNSSVLSRPCRATITQCIFMGKIQ